MSKSAAAAPDFSVERDGGSVRLALRGAWTIAASRALEKSAHAMVGAAAEASLVSIDLSGVERVDTAGVWLIDKARAQMNAAGAATQYESLSHDQQTLFREAGYQPPEKPAARGPGPILGLLGDFGEWIVEMGADILAGIAFLGELTLAILRVAFNPALTRPTSMVFHLQNFALRAVPIIMTHQFPGRLHRRTAGHFPAPHVSAPTTYAVDLICVLVLRELGVLLTSIMIAGRSGSAITAELGSMKMREEIDALRVMGISLRWRC